MSSSSRDAEVYASLWRIMTGQPLPLPPSLYAACKRDGMDMTHLKIRRTKPAA